MASNVTGNGFEDPHNQGWTPQLNGRGTMDIISSCALTVILCCWTSVCPNIPALSDSRWDQFRDKFHLFCLGIAGPEFVLGLAAGQLSSARSSVQVRSITTLIGRFAEVRVFIEVPFQWLYKLDDDSRVLRRYGWLSASNTELARISP